MIYFLNCSPSYDIMFSCKKCAIGCDSCHDASPCLSSYNWAFRISLLTISILCIVLTVVLGCYIYRYRKLKVIKVASPIFLCITLLGCAIMYCEVLLTLYSINDAFPRIIFSIKLCNMLSALKLTCINLMQCRLIS